MKHGKVIAQIEGAIQDPMLLYNVGQVVIVEHDNPKTKYAGRHLPLGSYAIAEVRVMVPLD